MTAFVCRTALSVQHCLADRPPYVVSGHQTHSPVFITGSFCPRTVFASHSVPRFSKSFSALKMARQLFGTWSRTLSTAIFVCRKRLRRLGPDEETPRPPRRVERNPCGIIMRFAGENFVFGVWPNHSLTQIWSWGEASEDYRSIVSYKQKRIKHMVCNKQYTTVYIRDHCLFVVFFLKVNF